jgi:hypothetical protein
MVDPLRHVPGQSSEQVAALDGPAEMQNCAPDGATYGYRLGACEGTVVGLMDGALDGRTEGAVVGWSEGAAVGAREG